MIRFTELFLALDSTTKTNEKIGALVDYFGEASSHDAAWAIYVLSGRKMRQLVPTKLLRIWAAQQAGISDWLFDESYHTVGDLAETISLIVPPGEPTEDITLTDWIEQRLMPLRTLDEGQQREKIIQIWRETTPAMRLVAMKLITGAFRLGVSKRLVTRAIAKQSGVATEVIAHRLMGNWEPSETLYSSLVEPDDQDAMVSRPYPFCLAYPIDPDVGPESLGDATQFVADWKWDGIRGQVIRRQSQTFVWSRGEDLMENRWPEVESAAEALPDGTVLDGEILASRGDGQVLPFAQLQRRIGRKTVGKKLLSDVPVVFHAFDLLELGGVDVRALPLTERRQRLEDLLEKIDHPHLRITELIPGENWSDWQAVRETSRQRHAEGLMLKRKDAVYDVGRVRGTWWKWKVTPFTIDAVLIYAQKGHGRRANLFTDYTFAVWKGDQLVPVAKAYSGLDDAEIRKVDRFVRSHTNDTFGPVRSVSPELVMEIAFEGLQKSTRHKSGIATRFPRIIRWRHDKKPQDADKIEDLLELLP